MAEDEASVHNEAGAVHGASVQARDVHGGIHIYSGMARNASGATGAPSFQADPWLSAARPISEWTARDLGVHESIAIGPAEPSDPPRYVVRRHDHEIRTLLRDTAARNLMVVLVGSSAAGKTRAAYEALRELPHLQLWPVMRPAGPRQLVDVLARGVPAQRVLWLDDARRRFLDRAHGLELAERLITTLDLPGPVLIVADMWTSHWNDLTGANAAADEPWRVHVQGLLGRPYARMIRIADSFADASEDEQAELERCAGRDPRLALAVRTAGPGLEITQVLSGGPQLLSHYNDRHYAPHAYTIITAAMDARRLGYESPITAEILHRAVEGYLGDRQRVADGGWFREAMTEVTRPHHGIAALTRIRQQSELGAEDGYVLHDFLDYHARDARARKRPPASLWTALAEHSATSEDLALLAREAQRRGLYRLAARFAARAAEAGSRDAMRLLAGLFELRGATAEARYWRQRTGDVDSARLPIDLWELVHRGPDEAELRTRADAGDCDAMMQLAEMLKADDAEEAVALARLAADAGGSEAAMFLADLLRKVGHDNEAEMLLLEHAEADDPEAMWRLVLLLERQGRDDEAFGWVERHAKTGDPLGQARLVTRLQRRGRDQEAEALLRSRADAGEPDAMWYLAEWLASENQTKEAIHWFQRSAERSLLAVNLLVDRLDRLGHLEEAEAPLRSQADKGEALATRTLVDLLERLGRLEEAGLFLRRLVADESRVDLPDVIEPSAMRDLIDLMNRAGHGREAHQIRMYGIEPDGATARCWELPALPQEPGL